MYNNGVSHKTERNDSEGVGRMLHWLSYMPAYKGGPLPILEYKDTWDREVQFTPPPSRYTERVNLLHHHSGIQRFSLLHHHPGIQRGSIYSTTIQVYRGSVYSTTFQVHRGLVYSTTIQVHIGLVYSNTIQVNRDGQFTPPPFRYTEVQFTPHLPGIQRWSIESGDTRVWEYQFLRKR